MNVRLPDGTVLTNIPEGTTRAELNAKLARNGYDMSKLGGPTEAQREAQREADRKTYAPDVGMGGGEKFLVGAGQSIDKAWRGLKGLVPGVDTSQADEDAALVEKHKPEGWQYGAGQIAGDLAVNAPLALVPGGLGVQMATGAAAGAAMTPGDLGDRAGAAGMGAGGALAGHALAKTLARGAKPVGDVTGEAKDLMLEGVRPTFGQVMGAKKGVEGSIGRGIARAEEAMQSVPIAGAGLRKRRGEALDQWRAATREAATPAQSMKTGSTVAEVRADVGRAYTDALDTHALPREAVTFKPDYDDLASGLPINKQQKSLVAKAFDEIRMKHLANTGGGVQPTAAAAHGTESELKALARRYGNSQDPAQQDVGQLFQKLADEFGDAWRDALPGGLQRRIKALDRQYPSLLAIEDAARKTGALASDANPNNYSPADLLRASRNVDKTSGKSRYIKGTAAQQELAQAGQRVLADKVADSGTAERAALINALGALGIGGAGVVSGGLPGLGAAMAGTALYGNKQVQKYLTGQLAPKAQEKLLQALRRAARPASIAGRTAAVMAAPEGRHNQDEE